VTLGGQDIYLGKWRSAASLEKYRRLTAEWLQTGCTASVAGDDLTVVELIAAYLGHARMLIEAAVWSGCRDQIGTIDTSFPEGRDLVDIESARRWRSAT
jgi:hypothetical protein